MKIRILFAAFLVAALSLAGCTKEQPAVPETRKLKVVATIFPLYDFARTVGGERADVSLLLPPGVESHHFEPRPEEILRLNRADVFVYMNRFMEPWAESVVKGVENRRLRVVDASSGIALSRRPDGSAEEHEHDSGGMDPHLWLDLQNASTIVEKIGEAFAASDPANADYYRKNAADYRARLAELDDRYRRGLENCGTRTLLHGGHYAFGYLARRYNLKYVSAFPAGDAEPNARQLVEIVRMMRREGLRYVFYEELASPRIADTIARETGAKLLLLNGAHNVTRDQLKQGVTFIAIMEENLKNLREGLGCR
jgi:zinc transport system substrate-binding protein